MSANEIAILALMVSIGAALLAWSVSHRQNRLQADQNRLQGRMLELEEARERDRLAEGTSATVTAAMVRTIDSGRLYVLNAGPAAARNIRVSLDEKPLNRHPFIHEGVEAIGVLGPDARAEFVVTTWDGMPSRFRCHITWNNSESGIGVWESELTFLR